MTQDDDTQYSALGGRTDRAIFSEAAEGATVADFVTSGELLAGIGIDASLKGIAVFAIIEEDGSDEIRVWSNGRLDVENWPLIVDAALHTAKLNTARAQERDGVRAAEKIIYANRATRRRQKRGE